MGKKKESFQERRERRRKQQEEEADGQEKTAEDVEKEMAEEVNAKADQIHFKTPKWAITLSAIAGILQLGYKIEQERERRADEYFQNPRPEIHSLVASMGFEIFVAMLIVVNCILLGWQASLPTGEYATFFDLSEHIFVTIFVIEWFLRVLAFGWVWVFEFVNMCDTVMVWILGVLPKWVMSLLGVDAGFIRIFTVLRALRLARLARAVRLKPAFKELWILIHGLTTSFRPLMWTLVIATILLFLAGLAATEFIGKREIFAEEEYVQEIFGDLLKSMYTMFQLMTMDTWADTIARPVIDSKFSSTGQADFSMTLFFVTYIGIAVFVFWNLITAIIVENAFSIAQADSNSQAKEVEMAKKAELAALAEIFLEIDTDGSGELTSDEFFGAMRNKKVKQMLDVLDIQASELEDVWYVLDDGDGFLTIKEFTTGIRRMRGQAKAKDMADTVKRLRHATASTVELQVQADQFHKSLDAIEDEVARIADDTGRMVGLFHEMYHRLNAFTQMCHKQDKTRDTERKKAKLKAQQEQAEKEALANGEVDEDE